MTPQQAMARAKHATALADAASDPRDKAAFRAAARTWERLAQPGTEWSLEPMRRELEAMKQAQPVEPQPKPQAAKHEPAQSARSWATEAAQATIAF